MKIVELKFVGVVGLCVAGEIWSMQQVCFGSGSQASTLYLSRLLSVGSYAWHGDIEAQLATSAIGKNPGLACASSSR